MRHGPPPLAAMVAEPGWAYTHDMQDPQKPLREQLDEAIGRVRRELEILRPPSSIGGGSNDGAVIVELEAELHALHEARGHVGPHDT